MTDELTERIDACIATNTLDCRCPGGCEDGAYCRACGVCTHLDLSLVEAQVAATFPPDTEGA